MSAQQPFSKPALEVDDHITLLKKRGLTILDDDFARHYLSFIGYYRLRGYFIPFQQKDDSDHNFLPGTTFGTILEHYSFDRELRLLSLDALERIESALKAVVSDVMCVKYGPHWYTDEQFFSYGSRFAHIDYLIAVREDLQVHQKTLFLNHYYQNYAGPEFPPSWMLFQILSFGFVSKLFKNLKTEHQKDAAQHLGFDHVLLASWFESLTVTRNTCAHHSRLYNLIFSRAPQIAKEHRLFLEKPGRFYAQAVIMSALLKKISKQPTWNQKLADLIAKYPTVPLEWMGFPQDWKSEAFWDFKN